jgi:bacteriorhodopsin
LEESEVGNLRRRVGSKKRSLGLVGYGSANTAAFAVWFCNFNGSKLSAFEAREPEALVQSKEHKEAYMFIVLFAILMLAWLGGFLVFHVSSALIHILLLFAVISLIAHLFQRKTVS